MLWQQLQNIKIFLIPIPEFSIPIPFSIPPISIPIPELELSCNFNSGIQLTPTLPLAHTTHHTYEQTTKQTKATTGHENRRE